MQIWLNTMETILLRFLPVFIAQHLSLIAGKQNYFEQRKQQQQKTLNQIWDSN